MTLGKAGVGSEGHSDAVRQRTPFRLFFSLFDRLANGDTFRSVSDGHVANAQCVAS